MQLSVSAAVATIAALITTGNAVIVCSNFNPSNGACENPCNDLPISVGEELNTPNTNCIKNVAIDTGFDLEICSGANLAPPCNTLQAQPRVEINGFFNWHTPGTGSILRTEA